MVRSVSAWVGSLGYNFVSMASLFVCLFFFFFSSPSLKSISLSFQFFSVGFDGRS